MAPNIPIKRYLFSLKIIPWIVATSVLLVWLLYTPAGLLGKADAVGYAVCHRIDARSFHLGDRQLPLCARCSGMYLGAVVGIVYQAFAGRKGAFPSWKMAIPFFLFAGAFAVDGANSYLHLFPNAPGLYTPNNLLRLFTGTGLGLGMAAVLSPAFHQTVWTEWLPQTAFARPRNLIIVVTAALLVDFLLLTENPLILYPLALISTAGVLLMLSIVYTLVLVMLFKKENRFARWSQLTTFLVGGFSIAILQIAVFDWGRFLLTGTWAGFHF